MRASILLATLLALAACSEKAELTDEEAMAYEDAEFAGETYDEFDERRDELEGEAGSYAGYGCTVDCGGHQAGYDWAAENGISDPDNCGGNSWSFIEGCRAYAEENSGY